MELINDESRLQTRFAYLFVPNPYIFLYCLLRKYKSETVNKFVWENGKELHVSLENLYSPPSLDVVEVSQIDDWLVFLKCPLFLERSDSFLAVFLPFIISALKWNLCLNGKTSAEEIQLNGKSCYTMFQCESFCDL